MATVSSTQSATGVPVYRPMGKGAVGFAYGVYEIAAALAKDTIVDFFRLPVCKVVDGFLKGDDLDTGTETLEIDVGYSGATTALLNSGVLSGDAVAGHAPGTQIEAHFTGCHSGPVSITAETLIIGSVTAAAAAGGTGTLYCGAYYVEP